MNLNEFRTFQREHAVNFSYSLVMTGRQKFLNAARLLERNSPEIDKLASFGVTTPIDLRPLLGPFHVLSERYAGHFFSPQRSLFEVPSEKQDALWSTYFYHIMMPKILLGDDVVRNVLRAVRALPSHHPEHAATALIQHFEEMTLPEKKPPWAPEDMVDF